MITSQTRLFKAKLRWAILCSLLFVVVYNLCNWITTRRTDVGQWYCPWELQIPFLPWMIFPYWSLDIFFVASFFICHTRRELDTLGRRLGLAILVAGACFLLLPLSIAFPRPEVSGLSARLFNALRSFDQPHNLFPSLHIAFCTILALHYARHLRGALRWASHLWFSLIGLSTLFTYQHHVVDVLGGLGLAILCLHTFREIEPLAPRARNAKVGSRYLLGTVIFLLLAILAWPLGAWFLWPAFALGTTALGYMGLGGKVYRKERGRLPLSSRMVMAPVLLGHRASFHYYRRQCRAWDEVAPGILLGRRLNPREAALAIRQGVTSVLDLSAESSETPLLLALNYLSLPVLDLTAPSPEQLQAGLAFISEQQQHGKVYIHCKIGYSRSAAMAAAFLMHSGRAQSPQEAVAILKETRPSIIVRPEIWQALTT